MNRIFQMCVAASMAFTASGCLITRGGGPPDIPKAAAANIAPTSLSYQVNWQKFGNPNPAGGAILGAPVIGPELKQSPVFSQVFEGRGGKNQLDITVNNHGTMAAAIITGVLSGLTLTVLPGYARDDYDMTAVLLRDGVEVKRYQYTEHVTLVMELLLVFGMPFVEGKDAPKNAIRDMTQHLVHDMVADGVLNG
jgi:hypothetical protein